MRICKLRELIELMGEDFNEFAIDEIKFLNELRKDTIGIYYNKMLFQFHKKEGNVIYSDGSKIYAHQDEDYLLCLSVLDEIVAEIREDDQNDLEGIVDRLVEKGYNFSIYKDDVMVLSYTNEFCIGQGFCIPNGRPEFVKGVDSSQISLRVPILG